MIQRRTLKTALKVIFVILQTVVVLSGLCIVILCIVWFARVRLFLTLPTVAIVTISATAWLAVLNGFTGYMCVPHRPKARLFFFVLTLAALLNLQLLLIINSGRIVPTGRGWLNSNWANFDNDQRQLVESHFECCGYETITDRSSPGCNYTTSCLARLKPLGITLQIIVQRAILGLFYIETLSLCILTFLKFGNH